MTWAVTNSGKQFYYDKINPDTICLQDIAHALSYQCRYNGHTHMFYSTAEHSMNIAEYIYKQNANATGKQLEKAKMQAAQALLHDAAEAYVGDMPQPFKAVMPEYDKYEKRLMSIIFKKYGLPTKLDKYVKELDLRICLNEKSTLFPRAHPRWDIEDELEPLEGVVIHGFTPVDIYPAYLRILTGIFEGKE